MLKNLEKGSGNEVDKQSKFRNQSLFVFIIYFFHPIFGFYSQLLNPRQTSSFHHFVVSKLCEKYLFL